ncbi:hypothetical protein FEM48_Zijuj02G0095000 [Ziziphus jujuba var. spinosa]|uniref:DUF4283 domain-containing protein n=1 Tax=Ziziphus jujuba var. spinosa TaxID=714518 RepID=A0A978VUZ0_ZIZJJ|nr:hypothetical protein FEM48_Zijuj02G0095000 [Ziziphus jujuba var. spinosa]
MDTEENRGKQADRARVWNRRPWTINGAHLLFKEWNPEMTLRDFEFNSSTFWVQIHGLPIQFMNKENAKKIGGLFKEVINCEDTSRKNVLGHMKNTCTIPSASSTKEGEMYRVWLRAEDGVYLVVNEGCFLRRVENPRNDFFDSFSNEDLGVEEEEQDRDRVEEAALTEVPKANSAKVTVDDKDEAHVNQGERGDRSDKELTGVTDNDSKENCPAMTEEVYKLIGSES